MSPSKNNSRGAFSAFVYALLLVLTLALVMNIGNHDPEVQGKVGFITSGRVEDPGWNAMTYLGVKTACETLGLDLQVRDQVAEFNGTCPQVVKELVSDGASVIILNSSGYSKEMQDLLDDYSNVSFYCASADYEAANLTKYSIRVYQARYLSGIVAGYQTNTNKVGIVAAMEQNEVLRSIDAFALGVRRANPDAEVLVAYSGSWSDEKKEKAAAELLISQGADVFTYHQDQPFVVDAAESKGLYSIGYYQEAEGVSDNYLTCAMCDWGPLFERVLQNYLRGQRNASYSWLGIESGVVRLTDYSPVVPQSTRREVEKAAEEILSGRDVFSGLIYDNQGKLRCGEGEAISDETLQNGIDWLVEGVRVYE